MRLLAVRRLLTVAVCSALLSSAGCGAATVEKDRTRGTSATTSPSATGSAAPQSSGPSGVPTVAGVAMTRPAALTKSTLSPDILVNGGDTLPAATVAAIRKLAGVSAVEQFSIAQFFHEERSVTLAAVDPDTFRRYTPATSAQTLAVWDRVAGGEMAITPGTGKAVKDATDYVKMGNDNGSARVHIGAYAPLVQRASGQSVVDAVVNEKWAPRLHMKRGNALLISTGRTAPQKVQRQIARLVGKRGSVQILAVNLDINAQQTAVLTGGSISDDLGVLRFRPHPDGSVTPDPAWVAAHIRTETVPILGRVTCNVIMLPELRAALNEIIARGLADKIHPGEYGGCFVPRYIAGSNQLSFHTYGTAIDINVPGNERGTVGEQDRTVVSIFEKWGFAWGGDWHYTDPMHFELHQIVKVK